MAEEERRFVVFVDDPDDGFLCEAIFAKGPSAAASRALQQFDSDAVFVFETKRATRYVPKMEATKG